VRKAQDKQLRFDALQLQDPAQENCMVTYVKVQRKENGESALNRYHASKQVERTKTCRTHLAIDGDASSAATRARIVLHSTNELITDVHHVHCGSFFVHVLSCMCFDSPLDEIGQKSLQAKELFQLVFQI